MSFKCFSSSFICARLPYTVTIEEMANIGFRPKSNSYSMEIGCR